jgi:hypothetical protein
MIITEDILPQGFTEITFRKGLSNYLINTKGEIYSKHTHRVLAGSINGQGYKCYTLRNDKGNPTTVRAHIAVARQFIPNHDRSKTFVNHIDENKANPDVHNLEWVTPKENSNYGTCRKRGGDKRKKPVAEYDFKGNYIRTWASVRDVIRFYADLWDCDEGKMKGVEMSLYVALKGNSDTSHGRVWRYADDKPPKRIIVTTKMIHSAKHSQSKLKLDYQGKVPDEYLYHEMTKDDIIEYFLAHERLTASEKSMIRKLGGKKYAEV